MYCNSIWIFAAFVLLSRHLLLSFPMSPFSPQVMGQTVYIPNIKLPLNTHNPILSVHSIELKLLPFFLFVALQWRIVRDPLKCRQSMATNSSLRLPLWYPFPTIYWDFCVYPLFSCTISWGFILLKIFYLVGVWWNSLMIPVRSFTKLLFPSVTFFTAGIIFLLYLGANM